MPRRKKQVDVTHDVTLSEMQETVSEPQDTAQAEIESDVTAPRRKNIAERLKTAIFGTDDGTDDDETPKQQRLSGKAATDLAMSLAVFFAIIFCWVTESFYSDPYKPVAPTQDEGQAIMLPVGRIVARRLKKAGKANPDTVDIIMCMTAMGFYVNRARMTHRDIYQMQQLAIKEAAEHAGINYNTGETSFTDSHSSFSKRTTVPKNGRPSRNGRTSTHETNGTEPIDDTGKRPDPSDELLRADSIGRAERGLY